LGSGADLGTRGYVGGAGTDQGANQSLSDVVRGGGSAGTAGGNVAPSLQALQGGVPATDISGQLSPELMALFGGGAGGEAGSLGLGAGTGGLGTGAELGAWAGGGAGAGAEGLGTGGAAIGLGGAALPLAAPLLMALPSLIQMWSGTGSYVPTRQQAYGDLRNTLPGFSQALQTAMFQGPEGIQSLLGNLGQWGLESGPGGQVGLSSVGHPYINQRDAVNIQGQLSQAVSQAMAQSGQLQQLDPQMRQSLLQNLQKSWADQAAAKSAAREQALADQYSQWRATY